MIMNAIFHVFLRLRNEVFPPLYIDHIKDPQRLYQNHMICLCNPLLVSIVEQRL